MYRIIMKKYIFYKKLIKKISIDIQFFISKIVKSGVKSATKILLFLLVSTQFGYVFILILF